MFFLLATVVLVKKIITLLEQIMRNCRVILGMYALCLYGNKCHMCQSLCEVALSTDNESDEVNRLSRSLRLV
jgi:hypothetical protein